MSELPDRHGLPPVTVAEEIANTLTHGVGFVLSIAALVWMVYKAWLHGDAWHVTACAVFGATLVIMYCASTVYHGLTNPKYKRWFRVVDHQAIYLLIAGSYTPWVLVTLRGESGWWSLLAAVWGMGLLGVLSKLKKENRYQDAGLVLYLAMGWMFLLAVKPLLTILPLGAILWIAGGGAIYTIGIIFYNMDHKRFMHAVWHMFVMGGSFCHVMAVLLYVIPG